MRQRKLIILLLLVCLFFPFSACHKSNLKKKQSALYHSADRYMMYIRWGEYGRAAVFLKPEDQAAVIEKVQTAKSYISDYQILSAQLDETGKAGTVKLMVRCFRQSAMTIKEHVLEQAWSRDNGNWLLGKESALPDCTPPKSN